jgi:MSHA biogenesis protein MshQ
MLTHMAVCSPCQDKEQFKHFEEFKLPEQHHEAVHFEGTAKFEVGQVETEDTHPDAGGAFIKEHTFKEPFSSKPIVAAVMGSNGHHSAQVQIFDVTQHGFKYAVMEPAPWDGVHLSEKVTFIAAVPGVTEVGGMKVFAGLVSTAHTVGQIFETHDEGEAEVDKVDNQWAEIDCGGAFSAKPAVLTSLQTSNNQALSSEAGAVIKSPWLVVAMKDVTQHGAKVSLDRCEVKDDTAVEKAEEVGYIAITEGSGDVDGVKFSVKHATTSESNMGWDDAQDGVLESVEFHEEIPAALVVASKSSRDGTDGGWARIYKQDESSVQVVVDEDTSNDEERHHVPEDVSVAVFSAPFSYPH